MTSNVAEDVRERVTEALTARETLLTPPPAQRSALNTNRSEEEWVEQSIQWAMQEYNFSFACCDLDELEGFLLIEQNERRIVVATDLSVTDRIFLYLHMLAHIRYGHVAAEGSDSRYEWRQRHRLPAQEHYQEFAADMWAEDLLRQFVHDEHPRDSPLLKTIRAAVRGGVERSSLQHKIHYLAEQAYENHPTLRRVRDTQVSAWLIPRIYRELDTDRSTLPQFGSHSPRRLVPPLLRALEAALGPHTQPPQP